MTIKYQAVPRDSNEASDLEGLDNQETEIRSEDDNFETEADEQTVEAVGDDKLFHKVLLINKALEEPNDQHALMKLCISCDGLVNDLLRKSAWPVLLEVSSKDAMYELDRDEMRTSKLFHEINIDVNRTLKRFPPGIDDEQKRDYQEKLSEMIYTLLTEIEDCHYYQGYHDVALTVLLVTDEKLGYALMKKITTSHLSAFMGETMRRTSHLLNYIYALFERRQPDVYRHLVRAELGTTFCLPWIITWFSHSLDSYDKIVRLFDYFIACPPLMPIYLSATMVLMHSKQVLEVPCDMADLHCFLSDIPHETCLEEAIAQCEELYKSYPPEELESSVKKFEKRQQRQDQRFRRRNSPNKNHFKYFVVTAGVAVAAVSVYYIFRPTYSGLLSKSSQ